MKFDFGGDAQLDVPDVMSVVLRDAVHPSELLKQMNISPLMPKGEIYAFSFPDDLRVHSVRELLDWLRQNPNHAVVIKNLGVEKL